MAQRQEDGSLKGQFENRAQYRSREGKQVKVDTQRGEVIAVRKTPGKFKRVIETNKRKAQKRYGI